MEVKNEERSDKSEIHDKAFEWLVRPCDQYKDELSECTSMKGRFHQYFIYGQPQDCSQWKVDYENCGKAETNAKAMNELVTSERKRYAQRMLPHLKNDTWENRKSPPEDWSKPLPEFLQKAYEGSYLDLKNKELKQDPVKSVYEERTLCAIM
ncbi:synaptic plasticity regulator PANTS isoform X1 [Cloeon dipterum]|uniref:synaptic plasticity regulator PANTS isoform X1 n=1 Tax=Cloeon dipterum TaxID=197152 RepID=UPI0032203DE5